ncbi:hypothetical protein [Halopseudomonas pelagia]|uniref:hypothetical protein n=1 Tax=Halopseudomonas pelagia TaxID=553151 RepID=UPI0003B46F1E|nr:hypothetical protein [Halopseudomonas pelagia]
MKVKLLPAVFLFLGSYFPLSVILLMQDITEVSWEKSVCWSLHGCELPALENSSRSLTFFVLCSVSLVMFFWVLRNLPSDHEVTVKDAKTVPNDLINYVFPYVVSFMGLDLGVDGRFYGFVIFLALMFLITYRSGQILMNPLLLAMGWQLYELNVVTTKHVRTRMALSKSPVYPNDTLKCCYIQGMYILSKEQD